MDERSLYWIHGDEKGTDILLTQGRHLVSTGQGWPEETLRLNLSGETGVAHARHIVYGPDAPAARSQYRYYLRRSRNAIII